MMQRTHLAITLFFTILFLSVVEDKWIFVLFAVIGTYLPDVDSRYSKIGQRKIARILQWFTKHRGMIHSFTFLASLTVLLVVFFPPSAFGFFLGYGLHLFADSFTKDGIRPFYPSTSSSSGKFKTGGLAEIGLFVAFVIADVAVFFDKVLGVI